jgi:hypothetical protein
MPLRLHQMIDFEPTPKNFIGGSLISFILG